MECDKEFWKEIFYKEKCGSGHPDKVCGWFSDFFNEYPKDGDINKFSTHVSLVNYNNIDTNRSFQMSSGLLSSIESEDYFQILNFILMKTFG